MSVINKMLRDLDRRRADDTRQVQARESRRGLAIGTVIVNDSDGARHGPASLPASAVLAVSVMVLAMAAGVGWYLNSAGFFQRKVEIVALVSPPVVGKREAPVAPERVPVVDVGPPPAVENTDSSPPNAPTKNPPVVAKLPAVSSEAGRVDASLKTERTVKAASSPARSTQAHAPLQTAPDQPLTEQPTPKRPLALTPTAPAAAVTAATTPERRSPAVDALAQAQSLWRAGSRQAAADLLRDALAAAESANPAGTPSGNRSELVLLVRELSRMDLIDGRAAQVLEMLTRLEPALSGFSDVWAIRGNAAQRLGRHQESVAAYLMALKLRPGEPRWMLGAAVSLAAQGQTTRAAELAEKARRGGVLSPDVAAYLRQLGVPLQEL